MFNVNEGYNVDLVKRSETLNGYVTFVALVRTKPPAAGRLEALQCASNLSDSYGGSIEIPVENCLTRGGNIVRQERDDHLLFLRKLTPAAVRKI